MSPRGRRVRWWIVVGLGQIALTHLAGMASAHRTAVEIPALAIPSDTGQYIFHGWPIVWSEYQQLGDHVGMEMLLGGPPPRTDSGPIEFKGRTLAIPAAWLVLAVCLPPVLADLVSRRRGPDGSRPGPSVSIRLARASILGAGFGLAAAGLDLETENHVFHLSDAEKNGRMCSAGGQFGPVYFLDRTINSYRPQPVFMVWDGQPVYAPVEPWIGGSEWYKKGHPRLMRYRQELTGEAPPSAHLSDWPRPEDAWRFRTRLTLASMGLGFVLGVLVFRPWRRSARLSPAPGTAGADGASAPVV